MKKLILLIFIFFFTGCFWKNSGEPEKQTEIQETGESILKVQVSPHVPSMISKRIGVIPFTGAKEDLGLFLSSSIANNLVISGLQVIDPKYLVVELEKSMDYNESFKHERIYCDPDLLHHHLVKIIGKRDENKVYISDINKEIVEENSKGD